MEISAAEVAAVVGAKPAKNAALAGAGEVGDGLFIFVFRLVEDDEGVLEFGV